MKTSALFQNTISSFFLKRARTVKYCAVFAAYVLCAIGTWGADYTWTGGGTDSNWTNVGNWYSDSGSSYPGTGDTAIFKGDKAVTVDLDDDIEISKLQTGTGGSYTVTINTNGHTLTSSSFIVNAEYSGSFDTNTVITGGGSVKTKTFDFPDKNNHNVTISSGTTLEISTTLYGNANDNGKLTFKGSGTLYLPASGANVDYGESKITYDRRTGLKVLPLGEPTYYKVTATGLDDFPTTNITITITRNETDDPSLEQVKYPYTFTTTNTGGGTFSFNGQNGDSNGYLPIEPTATDKKAEFTLKYSEPENLAPGDGFTLTIRTPDNSMELAVISYYKDKPRWTGAENSSWENVANWTGITNISEITSTSEITINSGVSNYPEISANVSLKSLTITSNAKVTMTGGTLTVDKLICTGNSNFTATGGTVVFGNSETDAEFSADYPDNSSFCNVEITAGKNFTSSNSMTVTENFTSNGNTTLSSGTLTVSGTTTVSSGTKMNVKNADFGGNVTNNGEISCGGGEVTFGSTLTNNGTITGGSGAVTFGETVNSGEITCSTTSTIFNGAVTVEASGTITGTDGAVSFDGIVTNGGTITGGAGEVSFGSTLTNDGTITGGSGELLFLESVTNDGKITAGNSVNDTAAVTFSKKYAGTGGTLVGSAADSTYIDFYEDAEFGTVTVNNSSLRFRGSTAQTLTPNGQSVKAVIFDNTGKTTLNGSLTANGLITVSGILSCGSLSAITANAGLTIENTGTLNAGDSKITLSNGTAWNNGGTLNAGNSEITLSNGTAWNNGGTFNCGTGTVIVSGSGATILGNNTFFNFKCTTAGATVTFEAGKTQTVSENFTITGSSGNKVQLTSTTTTDSWTFEAEANKVNVQYAAISNSNSKYVLAGTPNSSTWTDNGGNTNWFSASYIWKGTEDTDWDKAENWTDTNGLAVAAAPQKDNNEVEISIGKVDEPATNTLEVNSNLTLKSITVKSGSTIDLASYSVTVDSFTNNGTVRLDGTQSITGTMKNELGSTVEYYGTIGTSLPWDGDSSQDGKNYENLVFTNGASTSDTVTVSGTTTINTGSEDVKLSSTDNIFSGKITVRSGGKVSITAATTEEIKIAAGAKCNSLEINGNTALHGNVTTTGAQDYNGNVTLYANSSLIANSGGAAQTVTLGKDSNSQIKTNDTAQTLSVGTESVSSNCTVNGTFNAQLTSFTVYGETTVSDGGAVTAGTQSYNGAVTVFAGGTIIGTDGTAEFKSTVTNNGTITGSSGAVTFNGNVTNDGKISGSTGRITFRGTYGSSTATEATPAILTASSGNTYFSSDADFSYTTFTANGGTVVFNSATGQTLKLTNATTFNNVMLPDDGTTSVLKVNGTFNINGTLKTSANRTLDMQTNNSALNVVGTTDNSGEIKLGSQPAQFTGAVTNNGKITASDGAVTFGETTNSGGITCSTTTTVFNGAVTVSAGGTITGTEGTVTFGGNVTNDGEINGSSGKITFSGTYGSSTATETTPAKLTASSGNTNFSSDADFSYTTFNANGGIVLFSSTETTGQTLKLANTTTFNKISIQTSAGGFTAEGTENGKLIANTLTLINTNADAIFNVPINATTIEMKNTAETAGAVTFNNDVTAVTINNTTDHSVINFDITFNAATTVTNSVTFGTTGTLTLGNNTEDTFTFKGGITHTKGNTTLSGKIITNSSPVVLSSDANIKTLTLTGNSTIQTTGAVGNETGAAITLGAVSAVSSVSGEEKTLSLTGGTGNITVYGAVGSESTKLGNITIKGNDVTLQKQVTTNGKLSVTHSGIFTIAEKADITADKGFIQYGTGTLAIGGTSSTTSITTKNAPISFNGSGTLTLNGDIFLTSSSDTANGGNININTPVEPAVNSAPCLTLSAGKGNIYFNSKLKANKISVTAEKITLTQTAKLDTAETAVFSNSGILLLEPGCSIEASTITQDGSGENQIAGTITAQEIILKNNTYIYNETEIKPGTFTVCNFTVGNDTTPAGLANLYISALEGESPAQVTFNADVSIHGNYALFNGTVIQNGNLTVDKDIILLNGDISTMYKDSSIGVTDLFEYTGRNGSVIAKNSLSAFPNEMPDGTTINHNGKYISTFSILPGITISAGQNFYDNGTDLTPIGSWTLKLKANDKATDAFAELYNAKIVHCKVSPIDGGKAFLSAAENGTDADGRNNDGVFFSRPEILVHNAANAKDTDGNANLSGTYTVYDNVIRVEFVDSITKQPLKIENSSNEISAALEHIKFGSTSTSQKIFEGAYTTAECTQSTDGKGDLSVFFLKTANSDKWNTDATGISSGANESTDWDGTHRTAIPYLNIPKALESVWQTLRDEHKNRISHYYTESPQLSSVNETSGATFTATADLCAPVLVAVRTGQELHTKNDGTAESQPFYDSHNFIELQYSEPVNTGNILLTSTEEETVQNTQVQDDFGKIDGTSGNGLTVSGLIKTAAGMLKTGSNGTEDNLVHSLYRKFSVNAGEEDSFNAHSLRISIAGYVDKTVSTVRGSFKHWKGYIDSAETPSGTVTRISSPLIKDFNGNVLEAAGTSAHKLPELSVSSEESELYGKWDTLPPAFAVYKNITNNEDTGFEAIGTNDTDSTTLDRIEFHVFDNETNEPAWYIKTGWCSESKSLFTPFSYAADIFGGARPFSTEEKIRTSGGLRYASLYNKSSSFSYKIKGKPDTYSFGSDEITGGAKGLVFRTQSEITHATGSEDGLYFSVHFADSSIPLKTTFEVTYNENGFVTDLAGNRMKSGTVTTIDRTAPTFNMSVGAVPDDSGNTYEELYIIFNKKLNTDAVTVYNNDGTTETKQFSEALRESLRFVDSKTQLPVSDIFVSTEKDVDVVFKNDNFTGLKIPLNRSLTYGDIKNLWIQAFTGKTSVDPLSGVENANITYIQDTLGNCLPYKSAHAISDFAINIVNPIYAYDARTTEDGAFFSQQMYQDGSWAVHDWNAEQKNYGTLSAGYDLFIEANLSDENGEAPADTTVFAYFDSTPDTQAVSVTYNENISGTGLSSWRVWLPNFIAASSATQERSPIFKALSPQNNVMSKQTVLAGIKGEMPADAKTENEMRFSLNSTTMENAGWKSGDQISFLFALSDANNNPVKICHAPEYDSLTDTYTTEESPLFALRLKNSGYLTSVDLWSFKLQDITKQRGGVTIFNNVINAANGEKTVVQVNMPSGGTLNVIVMTLDGNIVKYLQHGEASQGEHNYTWDGTTKSGKKVARGLYFIRVFGNGIDETRKVMVVK
ncbi:FlgD immunoglobulin-like domain containing protein [Treponema porcinum]|uniref:FlgD immunoglobulin-like domain containing protein n=1 Tax=Treponema porcinum TaxID=261392 RepID=UPI001180AB61|nr:FlgD immunoglobulin-like domain containing protein [Treponema porcinum]